MTAKSFVLGVITGLLIAILFIALVVDRYRVTTGGPEGIYIIKSDRWTGRTWVNVPLLGDKFLDSHLLWIEVTDPFIAPSDIAPTEVPPSLIPPSGIVPPEDLPPSIVNPQQK